MGNNLLNLNSISLFPLTPNWAQNPTTDLRAMRRIIEFPGTGSTLQSLGEVPIFSMEMSFLLKNRTELNIFLDFMALHKGRLGRFWIRHPKSFFTLKTTTGAGAVVIYVERNEFDWIYQGYERFYFQLANGDIITRMITSVVEDVPNNRLELHFAGGLDRTIAAGSKLILGRLLLVRFDNDEFTLKIKARDIMEADIRVVELIKEYSEI